MSLVPTSLAASAAATAATERQPLQRASRWLLRQARRACRPRPCSSRADTMTRRPTPSWPTAARFCFSASSSQLSSSSPRRPCNQQDPALRPLRPLRPCRRLGRRPCSLRRHPAVVELACLTAGRSTTPCLTCPRLQDRRVHAGRGSSPISLALIEPSTPLYLNAAPSPSQAANPPPDTATTIDRPGLAPLTADGSAATDMTPLPTPPPAVASTSNGGMITDDLRPSRSAKYYHIM